ncbi:hypothetical protein, partial [Limnobacter sp.]|uniref:hypothetical protein n=1 Tax=Limnobacter sp. TaxID=2003368 RepID=UPI0035117338
MQGENVAIASDAVSRQAGAWRGNTPRPLGVGQTGRAALNRPARPVPPQPLRLPRSQQGPLPLQR